LPAFDGASAAATEAFRRRYGLAPPGAPAAPPAAEVPPSPDGTAGVARPRKGAGGTNELTITINFRAVSLTKVSGQPEADKAIAYSVLQELQDDPLFDKDGTSFSDAGVASDEQTGTFTFGVIAKLKRPLKL